LVGNGMAERDEIRADKWTESELAGWGRRVGAETERPVVLALHGELGAGKSVLARAIARGAGVVGELPSPTFNLLFRYEGANGVEVVHIDLYRLESEDEVWELGWAELGEGRQIVLIEWAERAGSLLPRDRWDIYLEVTGERERSLRGVRAGQAPGLPHPGSRAGRVRGG
jgi:tRNA threonylcarbamoyladenosine biosynthesis protein TsaE